MPVSLATSLLELAFGMSLGASGNAGRNRFALEGLTCTAGEAGTMELRIDRLEAAALRFGSGAHVLEIGSLDVRDLVARVRLSQEGVPRLEALRAGAADFSGLKLQGPLVMPAHIRKVWDACQASSGEAIASAASAGSFELGPLAHAQGTIRSRITDAHLLFDADVSVPIRAGEIDFNDATVEHVGPDSRMGVSKMGLYVDAPNGRSYLYQFASAPVAGVTFERRGALLTPWVSERGKLQLQPFAESMVRQGRSGPGQGLTQQARLLLGRTALSGDLQLGDGALALPGLRVTLEGRAQGHNAIRLSAKSVGRGLTVDMDALSAHDLSMRWNGMQPGFAALAAKLQLAIIVEGPQMQFTLAVSNGKVTAPSLDVEASQTIASPPR